MTNSDTNSNPPNGSRLMKAVETVSITPEDAKHMVEQYREKSKEKNPDWDRHERQEAIADKIVKRYVRMTGLLGGTTALAGVTSGLGAAVAIAGGASTDVV